MSPAGGRSLQDIVPTCTRTLGTLVNATGLAARVIVYGANPPVQLSVTSPAPDPGPSVRVMLSLSTHSATPTSGRRQEIIDAATTNRRFTNIPRVLVWKYPELSRTQSTAIRSCLQSQSTPGTPSLTSQGEKNRRRLSPLTTTV